MSYQVRVSVGPANNALTSKTLKAFSVNENTGIEMLDAMHSPAVTDVTEDIELDEGVLYRLELTTTFEGGSGVVNKLLRARAEQFQFQVDEGKTEPLAVLSWDELSSSSSSSSPSSSSSISSSSSSSG
ncbi:hypothetical protein DTL21_06435 [Bremerella cremea]|uniref:Uncharacterized protein n=1 Tax=Blastopirellula marina TaxID=124 RepID=A0A2S8FZG1_9BACT|nr:MULTISPECIES: hypothetical protein [Pirellulaceae]PQO37578.1 hypothetical protein C5Y83_06435 [Blastopirellula marina]RCS49965.1 hypothetical protein DTL21_06435 [Bremerella cremea]